MSLLEDLYSEDLIGDPGTLHAGEDEERDEPLFLEEEANEQNDGDAENDHILQTVPQSDNPVKPKRRVVKNPQPKLDAQRLKGPRGLTALEDIFKNYKFSGKGYEKRDLDQIMKRLEHWAHRLFPKYEFDDCLEKLESLGHKKPVMVYVKKIRMGLETAESSVVEPITEDNDDLAMPLDPFDELLSQQIQEVQASTSVGMPPQSLASSQRSIPSSPQPTRIVLTDEQRERMERNRLIAQERRLQRLRALQENQERHEENSTSENADTREERNDEKQTSKEQHVPISEIVPVSNGEGNVSQTETVESVALTADENPRRLHEPRALQENQEPHEKNSTSDTADTREERNVEMDTSEEQHVPVTEMVAISNEEEVVSQTETILDSVPVTADENPRRLHELRALQENQEPHEENSTSDNANTREEKNVEMDTSEEQHVPVTEMVAISNEEEVVSQTETILDSVPLTADENPRRLHELRALQENQEPHEENSTSDNADTREERNLEMDTSEEQHVSVTEMVPISNEEGNLSQTETVLDSVPLTADENPEMGPETLNVIDE